MGDTYPYLALAIELQRCGHRPVLGLPPYFAPLAARHGIEFVPVGPDLNTYLRDVTEAIVEAPEVVGSEERLHQLFEPLRGALPRMLDDLMALCRDADVLVCGRMQPAGHMVHELTGIPFVSVQVEHSGGSTPAVQSVARDAINPVRTRLGLPALHDPLVGDAISPQLALYALSRHICPPPRGWPAHHHIVGFFYVNQDNWQPDPALAEFVASGEPPVVISFSSIAHGDPLAMTELLVQAVELAGCRAIIQQGWSNLGGLRLPPHIHVTGFAPHSWLFARAAAVVHHAGAGTSGAVMRAGVPGVYVPHMWDQPTWAELAESLGCAGPMIPFSELTAERLGAAIRATLVNPRYAQAAAELGEKIRQEQGVVKARQLIEQLVDRLGLEAAAAPADAARQARRRPAQQPRRRAHAGDFADLEA
jgi:UDP:flavonoid glycosyltransferase YjiC (YdhE family)